MASSSALGTLTIQLVDSVTIPGFTNGSFTALFNPNEYSISRDTTFSEVPIPGLDAPVLQYVRGSGDTMNVELFFDITDLMVDGQVADGSDVRTTYVSSLEKLMLIDHTLHAPPRVKLVWGSTTLMPSAVAKSLAVTYSLFDSLGRPVRATAKLTFRQADSAATLVAMAGKTSPDRTNVWTVRDGDTLPAIAFTEYGDYTQWRAIADANNLADPLALTPGMSLIVPRIF